MGAQGLSSRAIIGTFYELLDQAIGASWVNGVSMQFQSDMAEETYKWLGMVPAMREWIGGRQAKGFLENGITIKNKKWEATLEVLVDELRRDKTDQVRIRIGELADRAGAHWASLLSTLILNAPSTVCYDGQYFFDTDHSEGDSGTQSNQISVDISNLAASVHGSVTAPSIEEMQQSVLQGIVQILGFKDNQGEPMNENANTFLVMTPMSLYLPAYNAFNQVNLVASMMLQNKQNIQSNFNITIQPNGRLTWTDRFAIFRTDGRVKSFIRQEEEGVTVSAIAEGSELEFKEDKHYYGIKAIRNVGYGYWQQACEVIMI